MKLCLTFIAAALLATTSSASLWAPSSSIAKGGIALVAVKPSNDGNNVKQRFLSQDVSLNEGPSKTTDPSNRGTESVIKAVSSIIKSESVHTAVTITAAATFTYALNNFYNLGPIRASSITALLAAMILSEKLALAATCGSFAGMAKMAVIPTLASVILGLTCTSMMILFDRQKWFLGVGGRLGFIAQCACTFQFIISSLFLTPSSSAELIGTYPSIIELLKPLPSVALFTAAGAFFMSMWKQIMAEHTRRPRNTEIESNIYQRLSGSCAAVGGTGLLATLALPAAAAGPAFCGSFIVSTVRSCYFLFYFPYDMSCIFLTGYSDLTIFFFV